jgi:hypothetical protein
MFLRPVVGLLLAATVAACGGGGGGLDIGGGGDTSWLFPLTVATDVAVVDVDGDGRNDVLTLEQLSTSDTDRKGRLLLYRQTTPGVFAAADVFLVGYYPWRLAMADVDSDGAPDLVVTDPSAADVWLLLQDASARGRFKAPVRLASGVHAYTVAVADFNGDAAIDVAIPVGQLAVKSMVLLYQDPAHPGSFLPPVQLDLPGPGSHAIAGDLNQDGRADLVLQIRTAGGSTDPPTNAIEFLPQQPDGQLGSPQVIASQTGLNVTRMMVDDYDGDGANDVFVYLTPFDTPYEPTMTVVRQDTIPGTFLARADTLLDDIKGRDDVALADLNRDLRPDVAFGGFFPVGSPSKVESRINVFTQSGGGYFALTTVHDMPVSISRVAAGDVNGDGAIDLVGFAGADGCQVMLQSPSAPGTFATPRPLR